MGRAIYGNQTHFVKLNDQETGGCWYECTIGEKMSDGRYTVLGQDGPIMTQYSVSGWEGHYEGVRVSLFIVQIFRLRCNV